MHQIFCFERIKKENFLILLIAFLALSLGAAGQKTITGSVKDESGNGMPGVSIQAADNTSIGVLSDSSGNYTLRLPTGSKSLEVSSVGYLSQSISIKNRSRIDIVMVVANKSLNQVVVTGYTSQLRRDITGSVSVVDMKEMNAMPVSSAGQALQGQASGVNVINSGVPGAESKITIRGINSFGVSSPLILIDGVQSDLNNINSDEIESMQVLKDAGSAAIYGVRGSNGVIIVTTKKGKSGTPLISYSGYVGVQEPNSGNALNQLNTPDFARLFKIAFPTTVLFQNGIPDYTYGGYAGVGTGMTGDPAVDPSKYNLDPSNSQNNYLIEKMNKTGTDWYHALFKPALITNHYLSVSGGTDKSSYLFSLGYLNQQGVVINTYLKRISSEINTQFKPFKDFRIGENLYLAFKENPTFDNQGEFATMANLYKMEPNIPLYDIMGNYGGTFAGPELGSDANPVAAQLTSVNDRRRFWDVVGNAYAEVDFLKHFTLRTSIGGTFEQVNTQTFHYTAYWDKQGYASPNNYTEESGYASNSIWTNTLTYTNQFGKSHLRVLAGTEAIRNYGRTISGGGQAFYSTNYDYLVLDNASSNIVVHGNALENTLFSIFAKADYSYDDRYLASVTFRRDGSSVFGSETRYGNFPAFSAGWRISSEKFMQNADWLNDLKIRGSYGELGSLSNISSLNSYSIYSSNFAASYYDIAGTTNSIRQGFYQSSIGNPNTGWETDLITDIGLDATILKRITLTVDWYKKAINGLLFPQPLPATAGGAAPPTINIGDIQNTGWDFSAGYQGQIAHDFQFNVSANVTLYDNIVKNIPGPGYFDDGSQQQFGTMVRNQVGHPVSSFFGYQVLGLFNSDAEVSKSPTQDGAAPGRFKLRDVNEDGQINSDDRTFIGNPNPKFTYGVNLGFKYLGFDLAAFFYGSQGNQVINELKATSYFFGNYVGGKSAALLNAWTPENMNTNIPKVEAVSNLSSAGVMNSFYVEDGSYLKLKSLVVGYTLNAATLQKIKIRAVRFYLQATNLFTVTSYSGLDPELGGTNSAFGIDYGNYPGNQKNYLFGCNISF
jgi:TonB-dependent starch-binding outer membrane protein SusC